MRIQLEPNLDGGWNWRVERPNASMRSGWDTLTSGYSRWRAVAHFKAKMRARHLRFLRATDE